MLLSGSHSSSSPSSSCLATGVGRPGSAAFQEPSHRSRGSKSPDSATPASARARPSPAGTPGRRRPGPACTWQWWCGNGSSRRAGSVACPSGPNSCLRAAAPPPCAHHSPPPASWWRRGPSLRGRAEQGVGAGAEGGERGPNSPWPFLLPRPLTGWTRASQSSAQEEQERTPAPREAGRVGPPSAWPLPGLQPTPFLPLLL